MKRNVLLHAMFVVALCGQVQASEGGADAPSADAGSSNGWVTSLWNSGKDHAKNLAVPAVVALLLARPVVQLLRHAPGYDWSSLLGGNLETTEDARVKLRAHVGGADVKFNAPNKLEALPLGLGNKTAQELLRAFAPKIEIGIDEKTNPLITDEDAVDSAKEQRAYAKVSLGPWSARLGCNVLDLLLIPAAVVAMNLLAANGATIEGGAAAATPAVPAGE